MRAATNITMAGVNPVSGDVRHDAVRNYVRARDKLRAMTDGDALALHAGLLNLLGGPQAFLLMLQQWLASRVRTNTMPQQLLGWVAAAKEREAARTVAPRGLVGQPEAVQALTLSFLDHHSVVCAARVCVALWLASRCPASRSSVYLSAKRAAALEEYLAHCRPPRFVPFLRARRLVAIGGERVHVPRTLAVLGHMSSLQHLCVLGWREVWVSLPGQPVLRVLHSWHENEDRFDSVVVAPHTLRRLRGEFQTDVQTHEAEWWRRFTDLRVLEVEDLMWGGDRQLSHQFRNVWPRLECVELETWAVEDDKDNITHTATWLADLLHGGVALKFPHAPPDPALWPVPDRPRVPVLDMSLATRHLEEWLQLVAPDTVIVRGWGSGAPSLVHLVGRAAHHGVRVLRLPNGELCEHGRSRPPPPVTGPILSELHLRFRPRTVRRPSVVLPANVVCAVRRSREAWLEYDAAYTARAHAVAWARLLRRFRVTSAGPVVHLASA